MTETDQIETATGTENGESPFSTIEEAIDDVRRGRMIVVCDGADRENEGDLVMAAQFATPEAVNFMAKEARGLICLALTAERCESLGLKLMAAKNEAPLQTAFTVTIEASSGVTTGISAQDRAHTIQVAVDPEVVKSESFRSLLKGLVDAIAAGLFVQEPSVCDWCDFTAVCGPKPLLERRRQIKRGDKELIRVLRLKDMG